MCSYDLQIMIWNKLQEIEKQINILLEKQNGKNS